MAAFAIGAASARFTAIGGYVAAIIRALEARGVATSVILEAAGLQHLPSNDPFIRVPVGTIHRLLNAAVDITGDPYFGLYAAKFMHASNLHAFGFALLASSTLRDLCERFARNFRFIAASTRPKFLVANAPPQLVFPLQTQTPHLSDDIVGLFLVNLIRELSDGRIGPTSLDLHRPAPPDGGLRHRQAFGCPVSFGAAHVTITFDAGTLDVPLPGASRELAEQNDRIVVGYLAKLDRSDIQTRVRALLMRQLASGGVSKEYVAKQLCMSPRTLQIKLSQTNTTFQDVVNETRHALACGYMENSGRSITEIAYLVGFSDTSNFSRAFRRWTGRSPRDYVAQLHDRNGAPARSIGNAV